MKNKKAYHSIYTLFAAGALLAAGCSNDGMDDFYAAHPDAVKFGVTIGATPATRVNTDGDGTTFLAGDLIGISADDGTSYTTYELPSEGSEWTPADGARYLKWKQQTQSFKAYYPVITNSSYSRFILSAAQNTLELLRRADYMLAEAIDQTAGAAVPLTFKHQLAKVTVILTPAGDEADGETVSKLEVCCYGQTIENGIVTDKNTASMAVGPYKKDANTFIAIVPPQEARPTFTFIRLRAGSSNKEYTLTGIPQLDKGKAYTLNLQVGHDGLKLGGITVEEWNTQEMSEGEAEDPTVWDGTYPTSVDEAKEWLGTETSGAGASAGRNHVFTITAARQLAALHVLVMNNTELSGASTDKGYKYATYKLANDIDLGNASWTSIGFNGSGWESFPGTFDGQSHTIAGFNVSGEKKVSGLFAGLADGGVIRNVMVKGNIMSSYNDSNPIQIGGIASEIKNATIAFCSFEGTVGASYNRMGLYIAGICGKTTTTNGGNIISCFANITPTVPSGNIFQGGILGYKDDNTQVQGCTWYYNSSATPKGIEACYKDWNSSNDGENKNASYSDASGLNNRLNDMNSYNASYEYEWAVENGTLKLQPKK